MITKITYKVLRSVLNLVETRMERYPVTKGESSYRDHDFEGEGESSYHDHDFVPARGLFRWLRRIALTQNDPKITSRVLYICSQSSKN